MFLSVPTTPDWVLSLSTILAHKKSKKPNLQPAFETTMFTNSTMAPTSMQPMHEKQNKKRAAKPSKKGEVAANAPIFLRVSFLRVVLYQALREQRQKRIACGEKSLLTLYRNCCVFTIC